ncbi:hypothetical protein MBLNU457_6807t1 [Dothideomycetes sp. NU457]
MEPGRAYNLPADTTIILPTSRQGNARAQKIFREAYAKKRRSARLQNLDVDGLYLATGQGLWPPPRYTTITANPKTAPLFGNPVKTPTTARSLPSTRYTNSSAGHTPYLGKRSSIIAPSKRSSLVGPSKRTSIHAKRASFAPSVQAPSLYSRREIWQDTPSSHSFPNIRPPNKRRPRPRSIVRNKSQQIRRGISLKLLSAYGAAKAPFTSRKAKIKAKRRTVRLIRKPPPARIQTQIDMATLQKRTAPSTFSIKPEIRATTTIRTVEISGPMSSPASKTFPIRVDSPRTSPDVSTPTRRLFKKSTKTVIPSPLAAHPPMLAQKASFESDRKSPADSTQAPPTIPRRSPARCRDSFNRAKVNVRRPPKGITHWFEALDEDSSDDDYPEVVESPSPELASVVSSVPTVRSGFQPSLGPQRFRAAPTSRVSVSTDASPDYFSYTNSTKSPMERRQPMLHLISEDPHDRSMLDLSSDEEIPSQPASPAWDTMNPSPGLHSQNFKRVLQRKPSGSHCQSMSSMQTTVTSATLPFMLRVSPVIDNTNPPVPTPNLSRHPASYLALTGRPPTSEGSTKGSPGNEGPQSECGSIVDQSSPDLDVGIINSEAAHMIAVTEEEMVLLDMMRRKRAAMQKAQGSPAPILRSPSIREEVEEEVQPEQLPQGSVPLPLRPKKSPISNASVSRENSPSPRSRQPSLTSTITMESVTLESGEAIEFPEPPVAAKSTTTLNAPKHRHRGKAPHLDLKDLPPAPAVSYWSPEIPTPSSEICELDAGPVPFRPTPRSSADARGGCTITPPTRHRAFAGARTYSQESEASMTGMACSRYNPADPYQLMPDLDFSDFELLPLPRQGESRSPSLTDGASFSGLSRSEIDTPIKDTSCAGSVSGFDVVGSESGSLRHGRFGSKGSEEDGEKKLSVVEESCRGSVVSGGRKPSQASLEVLNAWNALGGYTL